MTRAVDPGSEFPYILEVDRDLPDGDKDKPVFYLRPLKHKQAERIEDSLAESTSKGKRRSKREGSLKLRLGSQVTMILHSGLVRVENLYLPNDELVEWPEDLSATKKEELYSHLPRDVKDELADVISEGCILGEDEVKNSGSPDSSSQEG